MSMIVNIFNANCSSATDKVTKNGNYVLEFSVAVNSVKNGNPKTDWVKVELWNGNRESLLSRYSLDQIKGAVIELTGRQDIETFKRQDGSIGTNIVVKNPSIVAFYPKKDETEAPAAEGQPDAAYAEGVLQPDPQSMTSEF